MTEIAQVTDNLEVAAATPAPETQGNPAPAEVAKPAETTIASGAETEVPKAPADWPDDWRVKLAGEDRKLMNQLERFGSVADLFKSYKELTAKISSGSLKSAMPKEATPEAIAAWRQENGIPDSPEGYDLSFDNGLIIGESDKPMVNEFLSAMHAKNASPEVVKAAVGAYYDLLAKQEAARDAADSDFKNTALSDLASEWGGDFKRNVNMISSLLDTAPPEVREKIAAGRTPDGNLMGNDPSVMRWLNQLAREVNPAATVVPGAGASAPAAIADEMRSIEGKMGTTAYTERDRARYVELTEANMKLTARG